MKSSSERSLETNKQKVEFQNRIQAITGKQLHGASELSNYAGDGIEELVELVEDVLASYAVSAEDIPDQSQAAERAAFAHFGLSQDSIDATLSSLIDIDAQINAIIHEKTDSRNTVFVPPDRINTPVQTGSGKGFEGATIQPRAATIKFLIARLLNANWSEMRQAGRVSATLGAVEPDMVRQTGYELIVTKDFDKSIMVCDEVGNRTFIFLRSELAKRGINDDGLVAMSKEELADLIGSNAGVGVSIVYDDDTFVDRVGTLLTATDFETEQTVDETVSELLLPFIDETLHTANQITIALNDLYGCKLSHKTVLDIAHRLADEGLVRDQRYRLGPRRTTWAYSFDEFEAIQQRLGEKDMLHPIADSDDVSFPNTAASRLGLAADTLERIAELCGVDVDRLPTKRFQGVTSLACSKHDFDAIKSFIDENPDVLSLKSKVGSARLLSRTAIVSAVGTGAQWNAIKLISERIGIDPRGISDSDSPEIRSIRDYAEKNGYVKAPEGFKNLRIIGLEEGITHRDLYAGLTQLGDAIGVVQKHMYGPRPRDSYSPEQQALIVKTARELIAGRAGHRTEGRLTAPEIADRLGVTAHIVRTALTRLDVPATEQLVKNKPSPTYDMAAIDLLREDAIIKEQMSVTNAPEDVQSGSVFSRGIHVGQPAVERVAKKYHMPLGTFRFGPKISKGYFPADRAFIANILKEEKRGDED